MATKRVGGRPNVAADQLEPAHVNVDDERVPVSEDELTPDLVDSCYVDDLREVTNNSFRDEDGRRVYTISFIGSGHLALIYDSESHKLFDWECNGVCFERLGEQLCVTAAVRR